MKKIICILVCALLTSSLYASIMRITVPKNASSFTVTLKSNPTTGYQWTVKSYDKNLFELASSQYVKPDRVIPGAGGKMVYTFNVLKNATRRQPSIMEFYYSRSWEAKGNGKLQKVKVLFK